MGWLNLVDRVVDQVIGESDINTLMENIRVLGGNGTSAPSSDIETLFTNSVSFTSQAGPPSSTPSALGELNLDTTANRLYVSTGTASSADWDIIPVMKSGTETITGGGGDVTVNLPWSWEGGILFVFNSNATTTYFGNSVGADDMIVTTYDSLTNAAYSGEQNSVGVKGNTDVVNVRSISDNLTGNPKSATTSSFTLDDDGSNTKYIKWVVIA